MVKNSTHLTYFGALFLAALLGGTMTSAHGKQTTAEPDKQADVDKQAALSTLARQSDVVFVGSVSEIGEPPAMWSGVVSTFQKVTYQIDKVLKGSTSAAQITVEHGVVRGSSTAAQEDKAQLSTKLFAKNAKFIVFAKAQGGDDWRAIEGSGSVMPYTLESLAKVITAVAHKL